MLCFGIVLRLRRLGKSGPKNGRCGGWAAQDADKICTTPACESDFEVKIVKSWQVRSTFQTELRKICTMPARESDFEVKIVKAPWVRSTLEVELRKICTTLWRGSAKKKAPRSEHFWKLSSTKFAPRCGKRAIWKSKSLKIDGLRTFLEVQSLFRVAGAGISNTRTGFH